MKLAAAAKSTKNYLVYREKPQRGKWRKKQVVDVVVIKIIK
jgi:hypothetical protein